MGKLTNFLIAQPTFLEGVGRLMDLGDTLTMYNCSQSPEDADETALRMDMMAIAEDLREAIDAVKSEQVAGHGER